MAELKDLVNVNINRDQIKVQGAWLPVMFTMESFAYVTEAYGKPYKVFEKDMNLMLKDGKVRLQKKELHLMNALIYAMIRTGGTKCTPEEISGSIPINDLQGIFQTALNIFNGQHFQQNDMERLKGIETKKS